MSRAIESVLSRRAIESALSRRAIGPCYQVGLIGPCYQAVLMAMRLTPNKRPSAFGYFNLQGTQGIKAFFVVSHLK